MPENVVEDYGWTSGAAAQSSTYITPRILEILEKLRVRRVLDLGSGNGSLCSHLRSSGFDAVGVELDLGGVKIAKACVPDVPFYNFGIQDDPAALLQSEHSFDAVVSTEVIEHLFSPHLLPVYAAQVLGENGYLLLTTPYHGYLKNLILSIFGKWDKHHTALWHGGHIKFWSRKTLSKLLRDNGFEVTSFSGVGRAPYLWKSMVIVAQKNRQYR